MQSASAVDITQEDQMRLCLLFCNFAASMIRAADTATMLLRTFGMGTFH
jgi:hypothetical protein